MMKRVIKVVMVSLTMLSAQVIADTQVLDQYCVNKGAVSEQIVSVHSGQQLSVGQGDLLQMSHPITVPEPKDLVKTVSETAKLWQDCTQYALVRYQALPEARITFEFNQNTVTPESKLVITKVIGEGKSFVVGGHTDAIGSEAYNHELGLSRAEQVRAYLTSEGVADDKISTQSYGESMPVESNATAEGRAINRRVEMLITD